MAQQIITGKTDGPDSVQPGKSGFDLTSLLPAAGGIAGSIVGGAAGALVPGLGETGASEIVGGAAGGAIGQGFGEWIREMVKHQPASYKDIAIQGGMGAIFGAIPGTEGAITGAVGAGEAADIAGGTITENGVTSALSAADQAAITGSVGKVGGVAISGLSKFGVRAGLGILTGAASQGIGDLNKNETFPQRVKRMIDAGVVGGIAFPVTGAALDAGTSFLRRLLEDMPEGVLNTIQKNKDIAAKSLYRGALESIFGSENTDFLLNEGMIQPDQGVTPGMLKDLMTNINGSTDGKVVSMYDQADTELQSHLFNEDGTPMLKPSNESGFTDYLNNLKNVVSTSPSGGTAVKGVFNAMFKYLSDNGVTLPDDIANSDDAISEIQKANPNIPVDVMDGLKKMLSKNFYNSVPAVQDTYGQLTNIVADSSNDSEEVMRLNGLKQGLMKASQSAESGLNGRIPPDLAPEAIQRAIDKAGMGENAPLKSLITTLGLGAFMGIGGVMNGVTGGLMGVGLAFGFRNAITAFIEAGLDTPGAREEFAMSIMNMYQFADTAAERIAVFQGLQQLGYRMPLSIVNQAK
jgi:hypothetical protein